MPEEAPMSDEARLAAAEPIDPDVGAEASRLGWWRQATSRRTVAVVAVGGVVGAVSRYEAGLVWPTPASGFPWTTLGINLVGSALLAILLVLVTDVWARRPLLRPLLGTGVMGGFTTFSTFSVDTERLLSHGHTGTALVYVAVTLSTCGAAGWAGGRLTRGLVARGFG
jgi:fluoride exporter